MLKTILNVEGVQKLTTKQQKYIFGGEEEEPEAGGPTCGANTSCSDGLEPFWAPGCEPGCQVGYCQNGGTVTRPCF
ncbi:hypothetical protein [uncultured Dokdonia sp.]|uniref:hypothetical protein n=1 Tax=uncultured Dokdonia sp. TaxID=575653 RepID=UPI00261DB572|nr:hypothetical protein [uncultured Dokdonia sp.]